MLKITNWVKSNRSLVFVLAFYLICASVLFGRFRYTLNPDGISYISIAQKYADGNFGDAVNGYWGPLLSWLLAPFIYLHRDPQAAAKLISIGAGTLVIYLISYIGKIWKLNMKVRSIVLFSVLPLCLAWALPSSITPDLLVVVLVLSYVIAMSGISIPTYKRSIVVGTIVALGFYTKSFLLPFFILHVIIYATVQFARNRTHKKLIITQYGLALIVTAALVLPWFIALSIKYKTPTIATAGVYNFAIQSPERKGLPPMEDKGLLAPPNSSAVSVWEDPTYIKPESWSPVKNASTMRYFIQTILENLRVIGLIFFSFSVFSISVFVLSFFILLKKQSHKLWNQQMLLVTLALTYVVGYATLPREERYMWPIFAILLLSAAILTQQFRLYKAHVAHILLLMVVVGSIIYSPINKLIYTPDVGLSQKQGAEVLKPLFKGDERVASDTFDSIRYCYYLEVACYGKINPMLSDEDNQKQLARYKITDLLLYDTSESWQKPTYLSAYEEVETNNPAIRLLKVK